MKKDKRELVRLQSLIENDRLNSVGAFEELFLKDLHKMLSEYFEIKDIPKVKIDRQNSLLNVNISFSAYSVKNFNTVPNL